MWVGDTGASSMHFKVRVVAGCSDVFLLCGSRSLKMYVCRASESETRTGSNKCSLSCVLPCVFWFVGLVGCLFVCVCVVRLLICVLCLLFCQRTVLVLVFWLWFSVLPIVSCLVRPDIQLEERCVSANRDSQSSTSALETPHVAVIWVSGLAIFLELRKCVVQVTSANFLSVPIWLHNIVVVKDEIPRRVNFLLAIGKNIAHKKNNRINYRERLSAKFEQRCTNHVSFEQGLLDTTSFSRFVSRC